MAELLGLFIFIYVMYLVFKKALNTLGFTTKTSFNNPNQNFMNIFNPFKLIIDGIQAFFGFLFGGFSNTGMMGYFEKNSFINSSNNGLLIDGESAKLSEENSFKHLGIIARSGAGKTTSYIIPNILHLSEKNNSMIVTDLSGELYEKTSGYLAKKGYKIYILDPESLRESIRYNPLYYATSSSNIDLITEILISSAYTGVLNPNDRMWLDGAKTIMSILIKTLIRSEKYKFVNLANVKFLLNHFGQDGSNLNKFIIQYADNKTLTEWYGFINGNPKTVQSFISTAQMVLNPIGVNDNLEILTASHNFDFEKIRQEKSIIYIRIPPHKQSQYNFLQNLFYTQFFNSILDKLPNSKDLPVYCLLDEFGNLSVPNFSKIITTIRKYKVSISIVIQDFSQLELRYGRNETNSILNGGIGGKIFFSGADLDITQDIEKMMGYKYVEREDYNGVIRTYQEPVMSIRDIRTMKDDEVLFIYTNKLPIKLKATPYYKNSSYNRKTKKAPFKNQYNGQIEKIEYIEI